MSQLAAEFQFEIGDEVVHKSADLSCHRGFLSTEFSPPNKHIVVERHIQQCHGGVQQFYLVRGIDPAGGMCPIYVVCANEITAYPTPAQFVAHVAEIKAANAVAQEAQQAAWEARREERKAARAQAGAPE
jgi:hypothetical protein